MKGQHMSAEIDSESLLSRAETLVDLARAAGADRADAVVVRSRSKGVSVRLGKVESTDALRKRRLFIARLHRQPGRQRLGQSRFDLKVLAERAVAMARVSPEDPL